jgi:uncharacterized membrane protein
MSEAATSGGRADDGSVLPLVAVVLGVVVLCLLMITTTADLAVRRSRAQSAADAGALAGAAEGEGRAREVVATNGAILSSYREQPGRGPDALITVMVRVEFRGASAEAWAERYVDRGS